MPEQQERACALQRAPRNAINYVYALHKVHLMCECARIVSLSDTHVFVADIIHSIQVCHYINALWHHVV